MSVFSDWLRSRAVKKMAHPLAKTLAISYGGSEFFTVPQINVAYKSLRLDPKYIVIAYAQYLDFENFSSLTSIERDYYDEFRSLYRKFMPDGYSTSVDPAPVNEFVKQMSGLS